MIYLASQSPRRRELLAQIGIQFQVCHVDVVEQLHSGESAAAYVTRLAADKAQAGVLALQQVAVATLADANHVVGSNNIVLGADTIVVYAGEVLEKPRDEADAVRMLSLLSGRQHQVMTAIAVADGQRCLVELVTTDVTFRALSEAEIRTYWHTGEPADKAGSYAIQGLAGKFVSNINGSYSAVVGLPLLQTEQLIQAVMAEQK